jgi:hypothetical protein
VDLSTLLTRYGKMGSLPDAARFFTLGFCNLLTRFGFADLYHRLTRYKEMDYYIISTR